VAPTRLWYFRDASGNAFVTGETEIFRANTPLMATNAFVAKVSSAGALVWATYLGGSGGV